MFHSGPCFPCYRNLNSISEIEYRCIVVLNLDFKQVNRGPEVNVEFSFIYKCVGSIFLISKFTR